MLKTFAFILYLFLIQKDGAHQSLRQMLSQLTFKDINGLVEQNIQLRSLVRNLSDQIENKELEFKVGKKKICQPIQRSVLVFFIKFSGTIIFVRGYG